MPPVEFEPTISAGERPQTYALDRAATGTGEMAGSTQRNSSYCRQLTKTLGNFGVMDKSGR